MAQYSFTYQNRNGVSRRVIADRDDPDQFTVHTQLQLDEILESAKRDAELHPTGSTNKLVARVPMTIYEQSILEGWDDGDWKKWLNDPQNEPFRVWKGRV